MRICLTILAMFALIAWNPAAAQLRTPAPSPAAKTMQTVGLTDITVEYSRPSAKGREIFAADGLVPYGDVWRTGANSATKISFSDKVKVGDTELAAGDYAILTKPAANQWEVMFFPYEGGNWGSYVEKTPAATVTAKPMKSNSSTESFLIYFDKLTNTGAHLKMAWANTSVAVPITVFVDERVMADMDRIMAGPTANDYFSAASYLHDAGKDMNRALEYINKATEMNDSAYWMMRRKALILADMGKKSEAIAAAKKSLELAQKAGNKDYVRMNEKSIEEWSM
jgi:hypothetical protein